MKKTSAGILLHRRAGTTREVLLAHMGGPFWARRDDGSWTIPKGEYDAATEDALTVARREFQEELGHAVPATQLTGLGSAKQPGGKTITAWAAEGDFDPATATSNTFEMEWPRGSGRMREFEEIDRVAWFDVATARTKILAGQVVFLDRLLERLRGDEE